MTYKGHVQNGMVVLDEPVRLAEGASVRVEVLQDAPSEALHPDILRFTGVLPSDIDVRTEHAEDAVVALSAEHAGCTLILTRNLDDFARSPIAVVSPAELLGQLQKS